MKLKIFHPDRCGWHMLSGINIYLFALWSRTTRGREREREKFPWGLLDNKVKQMHVLQFIKNVILKISQLHSNHVT